MNAQKKIATVLTLLPPLAEPTAVTPSRIPEIRMRLRHQVKLLRSTGVATILVGLFATIMLWISAEPFQSELTIYDYYFMTMVSLGVLICSMVLSLIIYLCANEVEDQIKKLNKEV